MGFPSEIDLLRTPINTLDELMLPTLRGNVETPVWSRTLWYYLKTDFINLCRKYKKIPDTTGDKEALEITFPGLKYIYLQRRDTLAQGISMARAQQSGAWVIPSAFHSQEQHDTLMKKHKNVSYSRNKVIGALAELDGYKHKWVEWFSEQAITPLEIYYEDAMKNPKETVEKIAEHLGFEIEFSQEKLDAWANRFPVQQSDAISIDWRKRYEQGDVIQKPMLSKPKIDSVSNISFIVDSDWTDAETLNQRPQLGSGGGGVRSKFMNVAKCLPNAHFSENFEDDMQFIIIVEPMVFHHGDMPTEQKLEFLKEKPGIKMLWCEEQAVFRWKGELRKKVFDVFDVLLACNQYQAQLLKVIAPDMPILVLYTPIDSDVFYPENKRRQIVYTGKLGLQKNTDTLIELYQRLSDIDVRTVCIGNAALWGDYVYEHDKEIEMEMSQVADEYIATASMLETAEHVNVSSMGINFSIYDVGSLQFLESATAGCHFFAWDYHPMFDESDNVKRFSHIEDAVFVIEKTADLWDKNLQHEISQKHSFEAFQTQLKTIISEVMM